MTIYSASSYFKSVLVGLLFVLISKNSRSQTYIPMLNNESEWHVSTCNSGCLTDKYYTIGDTMINGLLYHFLDKFHFNKNFVIREDTTTRKIYMRLLADPPPAKDYLLYDFTLHVNDSISITNPGSPYPKYPGTFIVDSIVSKPLINKSHRYFYLHAQDTLTANTKTTIWVEGIGSLCLINTPGAMPQVNGVGKLSCYFNNNINEYSQLDSISDCVSVYPVGIKELKTNLNYSISQNFDTHTISINTNDEMTKRVTIYSIDGKVEYYNSFDESDTVINMNNLSKGLLLLKIENNAGNYYTYKLLNP
jgi:hypothetical protein